MPASAAANQNKLAICGFPLTRGKATGRGLERVVEEFCQALDRGRVAYEFLDRGLITSELRAVAISLEYMLALRRMNHPALFAVYPVAGLFPALLGKHPLVTGVYDMIPFEARGYDNNLKYAIKRFCIGYACKRSDRVIVPFQHTARLIHEYFGVPYERIEIVPLGFNHEQFYLDDAIPKQPGRVAFLGEAKRAKGMDCAILAFPEVLRRVPEARLVLASGGNELAAMQALAQRTLPPGSYEFAGFVPEDGIRRFYAEADVFVFPSRYGYGMSPVEAMACGTPVVVGDALDAPDFFTDPRMRADPNRPEQLAERIIALLTDRDFYRQQRQTGLAMVQGLSWQAMADRYVEIMREVGAGKA